MALSLLSMGSSDSEKVSCISAVPYYSCNVTNALLKCYSNS